jgi:hypothetical protein
VLDDTLPYDEPWGWMMPVRHALGALLLECGRVAEATEVYKKELTGAPAYSISTTNRHTLTHTPLITTMLLRCSADHLPKNIWSLTGLQHCLRVRLAEIDANNTGDVTTETKAGAGCGCNQQPENSTATSETGHHGSVHGEHIPDGMMEHGKLESRLGFEAVVAELATVTEQLESARMASDMQAGASCACATSQWAA